MIKILLIIFWFVITIVLFFSIFNYLMYWWVLLGWIFYIWRFKSDSRLSFVVASIVFLMAFLISIATFTDLAETIFRISLIGLIVGFVQRLVEFKKIEQY